MNSNTEHDSDLFNLNSQFSSSKSTHEFVYFSALQNTINNFNKLLYQITPEKVNLPASLPTINYKPVTDLIQHKTSTLASLDVVQLHNKLYKENVSLSSINLIEDSTFIEILLTDLLENQKQKDIIDMEVELVAKIVSLENDEYEFKDTKDTLVYTMDTIHSLTAASKFDLSAFKKILTCPVACHLLLNWIDNILDDITSFDRYIDMKESPPLLDLLFDIAAENPLQVEGVFVILKKKCLKEYSSQVSPLQVLVFKKTFLDYICNLLKLGYAEPIFNFISDLPNKSDDFLKVFFVKKVLSMLTKPYEIKIIKDLLNLLEQVNLEIYQAELREKEVKENFVEFFKICIDSTTELEEDFLFTARNLAKVFNNL
ncbi:hypothetical protein HK099_002869 [Clydaea vesicula]|uniref:Uncharacterized protein n=1 Tax=Clydaea vesicula TaxID=447962 RepID=A0AAD5U8I7_9FUNG|nr:hypothetical protein HK099_002869 [Clydaea vesicula]KAJ3397048.1 hypothetical protein HDU92_001061 [Lobulomyces angularis]